jgi:hypothetical protein
LHPAGCAAPGAGADDGSARLHRIIAVSQPLRHTKRTVQSQHDAAVASQDAQQLRAAGRLHPRRWP